MKKQRPLHRGDDVVAVFKTFSGKEIREVLLYCYEVINRALPDAMLRLARMDCRTRFILHQVQFELRFLWRKNMWSLRLAPVDDDAPRMRNQSASTRRRSFTRRATALAARARPQRKATLKRILFILYKMPARCSPGAFSPSFARMVKKMKMAAARLVYALQQHHKRMQAEAWVRPAMRLEPRLCGESLPMILYSFSAPLNLWEGWPFGLPREEEFTAA